MKRISIVLISALLAGCGFMNPYKIEETKTLADGTVVETKLSGKAAVLNHQNQQAMMNFVPPEPDELTAKIISIDPSQLSPTGQGAYLDLINELVRSEGTWKLVAQARDNAITERGVLAQSNRDSYIAMEKASASKTQSWARLGGWLAGGYFGAAIVDSVAKNSGARYGDVSISQSSSINGSGYDTNPRTGAPTEDLSGSSPNGANAQGFVSDGTRSNTATVGGTSNISINDQSPSAVSQPGSSEKPVAVDFTGDDFSLDDADANQNEAGLIPGL